MNKTLKELSLEVFEVKQKLNYKADHQYVQNLSSEILSLVSSVKLLNDTVCEINNQINNIFERIDVIERH